MHVQLGEDVAGVRAHGIGRDHQLFGDLTATLAIHHAQQYVPFARAEYVERVRMVPGAADVGPQFTQDLAEHVRREPGLTAADRRESPSRVPRRPAPLPPRPPHRPCAASTACATLWSALSTTMRAPGRAARVAAPPPRRRTPSGSTSIVMTSGRSPRTMSIRLGSSVAQRPATQRSGAADNRDASASVTIRWSSTSSNRRMSTCPLCSRSPQPVLIQMHDRVPLRIHGAAWLRCGAGRFGRPQRRRIERNIERYEVSHAGAISRHFVGMTVTSVI